MPKYGKKPATPDLEFLEGVTAVFAVETDSVEEFTVKSNECLRAGLFMIGIPTIFWNNGTTKYIQVFGMKGGE